MGRELEDEEIRLERDKERLAAAALRRANTPPVVDRNGEKRDYAEELRLIGQSRAQTGPSGFGFGGEK